MVEAVDVVTVAVEVTGEAVAGGADGRPSGGTAGHGDVGVEEEFQVLAVCDVRIKNSG